VRWTILTTGSPIHDREDSEGARDQPGPGDHCRGEHSSPRTGKVAAADFFTTEVWTPRGLVTYYTLFAIDVVSRKVHVAGSTPQPDKAFMVQVARSLTDAADGSLHGHRVQICDRDTTGAWPFGALLANAGIRVVQTLHRARNCNADAPSF
jgi:hypothetical protein